MTRTWANDMRIPDIEEPEMEHAEPEEKEVVAAIE